MEEPVQKMDGLRAVTDTPPAVDVSYVEMPERLTHRVFNASGVLGTVSFLAMLAVPGAVEGGSYILAVLLAAVCGICAHLSGREDGRK